VELEQAIVGGFGDGRFDRKDAVSRANRMNETRTNITLESASALVDQFEQLLADRSISVPKSPQTGADMLPLWQLLQAIRSGALQSSSQPDRHLYAAALAAHDLAAKVMEVWDSPQFPKLFPHLQILVDGAVHLTQDPPPQADGYNKLIELYWACLCIAEGLEIELTRKRPTEAIPTSSRTHRRAPRSEAMRSRPSDRSTRRISSII
jgi:hypothetical protein